MINGNDCMKLTVCLLASEAAPLSKTGGLADVSAALTKYLHGSGHDVRLFTPLYKSIDRAKFGAQPLRTLQHFEVQVDPRGTVRSRDLYLTHLSSSSLRRNPSTSLSLSFTFRSARRRSSRARASARSASEVARAARVRAERRSRASACAR